MRTWPLVAAGVLTASAAQAQDVRLTPLIDTRLRWERVDQDGVASRADAVTARVRSGVKAETGPFEALIETEATLAIIGRYNSGSNGRTNYPLVVDPEDIELNRAQLRYRAGQVTATAGRQLLELADQRFVGSASFRQNQQTFDAARIQLGDTRRVFADVSYAWSQRTVNGIDGQGSRPPAIGGDNVFALVGAGTPIGTLTGFAYLVDEDAVAVQGYRLESQTYGVRLTGSRPVGRKTTIAYNASWAHQSDWHRNPNDYAATYWLAEATGTRGLLSVTTGYEVLGADDGRALTSVQTPLASLFKFQGWADKFTTTPANGVRDLYAGGAVTWKAVGPLDGAALSGTWHRFRSDRLDQHYGTELDLLASIRKQRTTLSARYARYRADTFATDTTKFWLEAAWTY